MSSLDKIKSITRKEWDESSSNVKWAFFQMILQALIIADEFLEKKFKDDATTKKD